MKLNTIYPFLLAILLVFGCSKEADKTNSDNQSKDLSENKKNINLAEWGEDLEKMINNFSHDLENSGLTGTKKYSMKNNIVRKMASNQTFEIENGQIAGDIIPGTKIQLYEKREGREIKAIVMIKPSGNLFHVVADSTQMIKEYYETDSLWFKDFLKFFDDSGKNSNLKDKSVKKVLRILEEKSSESEKVKGIKSLLDRDLTDTEQEKIVEFIFKEISFESDQTELLVDLIESDHFSKSAKKLIISHLDEISMSSNKDKISKLLLSED